MKVLFYILVLFMCVSLASCKETAVTTSSLPNKPDNVLNVSDFSTTNEVINKFYSNNEREEILYFIDSVEFRWDPLLSGAQYNLTNESVRTLSSIEIKGLPLLIERIFEYESLRKDEYFMYETARGAVLAEDYSLTMHCILRIEYPLFLLLCNESELNVAWSDVCYKAWSEIKDSLEKTLNANISADEKLKFYRKMGMLSVPYVVKELEKGNTELETFFALVGAHLTTEEYLLSVERDDYANPRISSEEFDSALIASSEGFNYKLWVEENQKDINNLFEYLDEHCAKYKTN